MIVLLFQNQRCVRVRSVQNAEQMLIDLPGRIPLVEPGQSPPDPPPRASHLRYAAAQRITYTAIFQPLPRIEPALLLPPAQLIHQLLPAGGQDIDDLLP
ncbi:hypothetical protein D3C80_1794210 [compost metagenome]